MKSIFHFFSMSFKKNGKLLFCQKNILLPVPVLVIIPLVYCYQLPKFFTFGKLNMLENVEG